MSFCVKNQSFKAKWANIFWSEKSTIWPKSGSFMLPCESKKLVEEFSRGWIFYEGNPKSLTFNEFLSLLKRVLRLGAIQELMDEIEIFAIFEKMENSDNMMMDQEFLMEHSTPSITYIFFLLNNLWFRYPKINDTFFKIKINSLKWNLEFFRKKKKMNFFRKKKLIKDKNQKIFMR